MTLKQIDEKNLVDSDFALYYLSCESLCVETFNFFSAILKIKPKFSESLEKPFFATTHQLMRVFKNSKVIYETIYKAFSNMEFNAK